jgi:hypothetical protein
MGWPKGKPNPAFPKGIRPSWLDEVQPKPCDPRVHKVVKFVHDELYRQGRMQDFERKAGIARFTMQDWFYRVRDPRLSTLDAAVQALGYRITVEKIK